jgi:hypothetical protein
VGLWAGLQARSPWLAPHDDARRRILAAHASGMSVADTLNAALASQPPIELAAGRLCFVDPREVPRGVAYETFIAGTARVPTRDNLHDLFNGLAWFAFPDVKRRLNELHAGQIERTGIAATRGAVRDALTLFDENAAWLQAPQPLIDALRRRDWHTLFVARRDDWSEARLTLFGHALLEKLTRPRKAITAHVWCLPPCADAESAIIEMLTPERLASRSHLPLPVLGVPGWWHENEREGFYDDAGAFRPPLG